MLDIRQSESYAKYLRSLGWSVERINEVNYFIKKLPILGSILKIQRPEKIDFTIIDRLCRKYRVFQIIIEPNLTPIIDSTEYHELMLSHGFKLSKSTYLPSKTLQIDLTKSKKQIYANFSKDCKYSIRKNTITKASAPNGGEGVYIKEYSTPNEIIKFREEWKNCVKLRRYVPSSDQLIKLKDSFPHNKSLFLASHNIVGRIIGGVLFTTSSHGISNYITYYWQAFTNNEGHSTLSQYTLLYQGILWAKENGYRIFDFEGIFDPRFPNDSWLGFTHFKRSFGGYEVEYPGCYAKFRLPL
jgi:hypothetical protein